MSGTQRVWVQPAHLVVKESQLRAMFKIPDDQDLDGLDPQALQDMVGWAMLCVDTWNVELDEDWREDYPEPFPDSNYCRCGHSMDADSYPGHGHVQKFEPGGRCRAEACGCQKPEPAPPPPWVRQPLTSANGVS